MVAGVAGEPAVDRALGGGVHRVPQRQGKLYADACLMAVSTMGSGPAASSMRGCFREQLIPHAGDDQGDAEHGRGIQRLLHHQPMSAISTMPTPDQMRRRRRPMASVPATEVEGDAVTGRTTSRAVKPCEALARWSRSPRRRSRSSGTGSRNSWPPGDQSTVIPARRCSASAYLARVRAMTSAGTFGPGAVLFQSSVSR